jgi:hypothetical protein
MRGSLSLPISPLHPLDKMAWNAKPNYQSDSQLKVFPIKTIPTRHQWLTPIILVTHEAEIRRIAV